MIRGVHAEMSKDLLTSYPMSELDKESRRHCPQTEYVPNGSMAASQPPSPCAQTDGLFKMSIEVDDPPENRFSETIRRLHKSALRLQKKYSRTVRNCLIVLSILGYCAYLSYAIYYSFQGAVTIIILTSLGIIFLVYSQLSVRFGPGIKRTVVLPTTAWIDRYWNNLRWCVYVSISVAVILFFALDTAQNPKSLVSLGGLFFFIFITFITSKHPGKVRWRPVLWGIGLQFLLGLLILRWPAGFLAFRAVSNEVTTFLGYTDEGSKLVFGNPGYLMHAVAFKVLPVVVFFSSVINVLFYLGIMQVITQKLAWVMRVTMGTTAIESLSAAASIFLGQVVTAPILGPFMMKLTSSELHACMTEGFATIAGNLMPAYVLFGAPAEHVLAAAVVSAPAGLALAKLGFPETEQSQLKEVEDVQIAKGEEGNIIEAIANGAASSIKLVAGIVVSVIAFVSITAFFNATLSYIGGRVGYPQLSFQLICSYVFMPLAAMMGVDWEDAGRVASLLGTKIFVSEFVAYAELGPLIKEGIISARSAVITTYALCGFGSVVAIGINIGALGAVAPQRKGEIAQRALRAMVAGNIACFMTACVAGILYQEGAVTMFTNSTAMGNDTTLASVMTTSLP